MWFVYNVSIEAVLNGDGRDLKVDVMKSSECEVQTRMQEANIRHEDSVRVRVKTHFHNSKFLPVAEVPARENVRISCFSQLKNIRFTGGCQKKGAPHQKRFTWIIMAINKENVDKSYVFVLS